MLCQFTTFLLCLEQLLPIISAYYCFRVAGESDCIQLAVNEGGSLHHPENLMHPPFEGNQHFLIVPVAPELHQSHYSVHVIELDWPLDLLQVDPHN